MYVCVVCEVECRVIHMYVICAEQLCIPSCLNGGCNNGVCVCSPGYTGSDCGGKHSSVCHYVFHLSDVWVSAYDVCVYVFIVLTVHACTLHSVGNRSFSVPW